ncbi:GFA family protein [Altererythrobacter aerius]|uniref:GFA family protein n=1 Tax=Tsuneonella aeria TaxID=1837929 RepID=A0A6I4T9F5_9SPHN|nr:GFA family protein [Tsuneonella aeria]MXO73802.1 GFA family protein [Tsuneonella aeria]
MLAGSCCCGTVRFEVSQSPTMMGTCHCTRCRKVGASTFVFVDRAAFELVAGQPALATYQPEDGYKYARDFCSRCGTALGEISGDGDSFPIPANCFDDPLDLAVKFHEFVAEKPGWLPICDDARQFAGHPHKD